MLSEEKWIELARRLHRCDSARFGRVFDLVQEVVEAAEDVAQLLAKEGPTA